MPRGTIKAYTHELNTFQRYLADSVNCIDDITPHTIREYLLHLQVEKGRNPGGCHIAYRVIKTWLFWWELEVDGYTAPIREVKAPRLNHEPLEPVSLDHVQELQGTCQRDNYGIHDKALLLTLIDTGVRAKALLAVNLEDIP